MTTIEAQLVDLGEHLDAPAGDALASRIAAAVRARRRRSARRRLAIALAALVVLFVTASFVPAVGDWLGVRGAEVRQAPAPRPADDHLDLGMPTTLDAAARRVGFEPLVAPALGTPDGVWLDTRPAVPIVTLTYPDGRLVSQFEAVADAPIIRKFAAGFARVAELDVEGHPAIWIEGVHEVAIGRGGEVFVDELRLSDSALLVEVGDVTVRIETRHGRADALRVARNLVGVAGVVGP